MMFYVPLGRHWKRAIGGPMKLSGKGTISLEGQLCPYI